MVPRPPAGDMSQSRPTRLLRRMSTGSAEAALSGIAIDDDDDQEEIYHTTRGGGHQDEEDSIEAENDENEAIVVAAAVTADYAAGSGGGSNAAAGGGAQDSRLSSRASIKSFRSSLCGGGDDDDDDGGGLQSLPFGQADTSGLEARARERAMEDSAKGGPGKEDGGGGGGGVGRRSRSLTPPSRYDPEAMMNICDDDGADDRVAADHDKLWSQVHGYDAPHGKERGGGSRRAVYALIVLLAASACVAVGSIVVRIQDRAAPREAPGVPSDASAARTADDSILPSGSAIYLPTPPENLSGLCSCDEVSTQSGFEKCKDVCEKADCCYFEGGKYEALSCRADNQDACEEYESNCMVLDLDTMDIVCHGSSYSRRDGQEEHGDGDEEIASEAILKVEETEAVMEAEEEGGGPS